MTTSLMRRPVDLHPTDTANRLRLIQHLADLRRAHGLRINDIGERLGLGSNVIGQFENRTNPKISTVQRVAHALSHRLLLLVDAPPGFGLEDPCGRVYAALAEATGSAERRHEAQRSQTLARLVAGRRWLDYDQVTLAQHMGCSPSAVQQIEQDRKDPILSTYQRYARALGGVLLLTLQPDLTPLED